MQDRAVPSAGVPRLNQVHTGAGCPCWVGNRWVRIPPQQGRHGDNVRDVQEHPWPLRVGEVVTPLEVLEERAGLLHVEGQHLPRDLAEFGRWVEDDQDPLAFAGAGALPLHGLGESPEVEHFHQLAHESDVLAEIDQAPAEPLLDRRSVGFGQTVGGYPGGGQQGGVLAGAFGARTGQRPVELLLQSVHLGAVHAPEIRWAYDALPRDVGVGGHIHALEDQFKVGGARRHWTAHDRSSLVNIDGAPSIAPPALGLASLRTTRP